MKRIDFQEGWSQRRLGTEDEFRPISVPYDSMLHENRSDDSPGGCNNGWFEGYDYEYIKEFELPPGKNYFLECEGIYHRGEVYLNGEKVGYRPNGYLGIFAEVTRFVKNGTNTLRVIARGADIPNSRWYTGVGIYRPVWFYAAGERFIEPNTLRIRTLSVDPARIEVSFGTRGEGSAEIEVLDGTGPVASAHAESKGEVRVELTVPNASLWAPGSPALYTLRVTFGEDVTEESFGIRTVSCDAEHGFLINGKRVILRGACLHHDNGLLGSVSLPEAEERKVRILRSCGFNAIRSSHNPCSKALLGACDKYGVLMMDEYADSWYVRKTKHDYALYLGEWYEQDLKDMVEKDFNHPCVVLYSLGNEVTETAEDRGVELFRRMRDTVKKYDDTRPVTCGINIGFNQAAMAGHSFFSDEKAEKNDFKNLGTESANHRKWMFGPLFTKLNAILPGCDKATRKIFAESDVAGYNYGILRYRHDRRKYPKRIILGSETFCEDAEKFRRAAERDAGVIGDFVWTGFDHLGEAGLGSWEYRDYAPTYIHTKGWLTSGAGRIDITGKPLPEAYYMLAAYGMLKKPHIAVLPVNHNGERHSPSGWKFTNAVSSWAWTGCEGKKAHVEVYACGAYVELYLNNKRLGRKSVEKSCRVRFTVPYRKGVLSAICYDKHGKELGRSQLQSAEDETVLRLEPEGYCGKGKLCYVRIRLTDGNGTTKVLSREKIGVRVTGGDLLGLGHACPYNEEGYTGSSCSTYFGEALAVIRAGGADRLSVHAECPSAEQELEISLS